MKLFLTICSIILSVAAYSQGMSFKEAKAKGISPKADSIYKSAIHSEADKAVFTAEEDVQRHILAYQKFLQDLGSFLDANNFKWEDVTRGFNRIYMKPDGTIDYFLYDFKTPLREAKQKEFERLLNLYIKDHKFGITAPEKFAQCSPVTYPKTSE
jgi:hypothetical protein